MYQAELKGKLPPSATDREDVLTSNVFSFLKYSHRATYLRQFLLRLAQLDVPPVQLPRVTFDFWPCLDDGTQPDVVIETDTHYLLIEAKYHSGVAEENGNPAGQLIRECQAGLIEAANRSKNFRLLLINDESTRPTSLLAKIPVPYQQHVFWTNWQRTAEILLRELDASGSKAPDNHFAEDLYQLLDAKHLRGFISFGRCPSITTSCPAGRHLFFAAETASFRGAFIGIAPSLSTLAPVSRSPAQVFYTTDTRLNLPIIHKPLFKTHIFFPGPYYEQRT